MGKGSRTIVAGLMLAGCGLIPSAQAQVHAAPRELARTQPPAKGETCRPQWPYIVLTCVA